MVKNYRYRHSEMDTQTMDNDEEYVAHITVCRVCREKIAREQVGPAMWMDQEYLDETGGPLWMLSV